MDIPEDTPVFITDIKHEVDQEILESVDTTNIKRDLLIKSEGPCPSYQLERILHNVKTKLVKQEENICERGLTETDIATKNDDACEQFENQDSNKMDLENSDLIKCEEIDIKDEEDSTEEMDAINKLTTQSKRIALSDKVKIRNLRTTLDLLEKDVQQEDNILEAKSKQCKIEPFIGSKYISETSSENKKEEGDEKIRLTGSILFSKSNKAQRAEDENIFLIENNEASTGFQYEDIVNKERLDNGSQSSCNSDGTIAKYEKRVKTSSRKIECFTDVKSWTKKTSCPYCFKDVTHFSRHLQRHHKNEEVVKEIFSLSLNDSKRKHLLLSIRRQGNFVASSHNNVIRPVRRAKSQENYSENSENLKEKYVVCQNCLGYFRRKFLYRHRKKCFLKTNKNEASKREEYLSTAQIPEVCSDTHDNGSQSSSNSDGTIVTYEKCVDISSRKVEYCTNNKSWSKKTSCPYCFKDVTHFPRHLQRNHKNEGVVKEIFSLSLNDSKRKHLLLSIRRQGNFVANSHNNIIRPVRRAKSQENYSENSENLKEKYVVCQNCLGYFRRKYLYKHRKKCFLKTNKFEASKREDHLSTAQIFEVCSGTQSEFYSNLKLTKEVFPIMRSDDISKIAMSDILICSYAESLLLKPQHPQIKNVISNKMRELGRLFIILKGVTGSQTFCDILKPQFLDNLIAGTKIISGYDPETRTFRASNLARYMGARLKQVCGIATRLILKKSPFFPCTDPDQTLKDIKQLKKLLENNWNSEVSCLIVNNLKRRKPETPKLLSLVSDVMKFQQFVMIEAKDAFEKVTQGEEIKKEYKRLAECVLALTLLLNQKKVSEIQYLEMETYNKAIPQNQLKEIVGSLSETEKALTKSCKTVVTLGRGGKPIAIYFSQDMQFFIDTLLSIRDMCIEATNNYLFANPNTANSCLYSNRTLKKLVGRSDVGHKSVFTSSQLGKQITTILQVINLPEDELKEFVKFMGHTRKEYDRFPLDAYETAKLCKLLFVLSSANTKNLNREDIKASDNFDSDSELDSWEVRTNKSTTLKTSNSVNDITTDRIASDKIIVESGGKLPHDTKTINKNIRRKVKINRIPWTQKQKDVISDFFKEHIEMKRAPRKHEVEDLVENHKTLFKDKSWVKIKAFVYNCYR